MTPSVCHSASYAMAFHVEKKKPLLVKREIEGRLWALGVVLGSSQTNVFSNSIIIIKKAR